MTAVVIGTPLGLLVGMPTGVILLLLCREGWEYRQGHGSIYRVIVELLALPAFWVGGPWISGFALHSVDWGQVLPWYLVGLLAMLCFIDGQALLRLSRHGWRIGIPPAPAASGRS